MRKREGKMEKRDEKFIKVIPNPIKHLIIAQNSLGRVILRNRGVAGENEDYFAICDAQNQIGLALEQLNKMEEKK